MEKSKNNNNNTTNNTDASTAVDEEKVESCAQTTVSAIQDCIHALRQQVKPTPSLLLKSNNQNTTKQCFLLPFQELVQDGTVAKIQTKMQQVQEQLLSLQEKDNDHDDDDDGDNDDIDGVTLLLSSLNNNKTNTLEEERGQMIHVIVLPLLQLLTRCYEILDALPSSSQPQQQQLAKKNKNKTNNKNKPPPPRGMLSIQNYTDIACLLEFCVLLEIVPKLEPNVLPSVSDRIRYHFPKSLMGRLPRSSLLVWFDNDNDDDKGGHSKHNNSDTVLATTATTTTTRTHRHQNNNHDSDELLLRQTATILGRLLLLDRFRPMLLPRHLPDLYAALFQCEQIQKQKQKQKQKQSSPKEEEETISTTLPKIYQQLGLTQPGVLDPTLQAKTYQTLLLHGTKGPAWIRKRVSPLLQDLAGFRLAAIVQVFVPFSQQQQQEMTAAVLRLGRALGTTTHPQALTRQILSLLTVVSTTNSITLDNNSNNNPSSSSPVLQVRAQHMAILQTIWAVLDQNKTIVQQLLQTWKLGIMPNNHKRGQETKSIHATILQIGSLACCCCDDGGLATSTFFLANQQHIPVLQQLFVPDKENGCSIFGQLVRIVSMPGILASKAVQDARQTLHWISMAMMTSSNQQPQNQTPNKKTSFLTLSGISGMDILVAGWMQALMPSSWDALGNRYVLKPSTMDISNNKNPKSRAFTELEHLEIQQDDENQITNVVEWMVELITKRSEVLLQITKSENATTADPQESTTTTASRWNGVFLSCLFRLLLRLFLSFSSASNNKKTTNVADGKNNMASHFRLVTMVLLPMLCEQMPQEDLLFGDEKDALGLLHLIKLVLSSTKCRLVNNNETRFQQEPSNAATLNATHEDDDDHTEESKIIKILAQIQKKCLQHDDKEKKLLFPMDITSGIFELEQDEQNQQYLSIASIMLSLLIAVLELGTKLRSTKEEASLQSFLPLLRAMAEFGSYTHQHTSTDLKPTQEAEAGIADMASYAMALIASRQAPPVDETLDKHTEKDPAQLSTIDKLKQTIQEAQEDLASTQPPLRARGMVSLGRLARGYLGILPTENEKPSLIMELGDSQTARKNSNDVDPICFLIQEVLRLSMIALSDNESYVYLAAVQTIVAMCDMRPRQVLPILLSGVASGTLHVDLLSKSIVMTSPSSLDIPLTQEQRIKLAEALMFSIRRRAAPDEFVSMVIHVMVFGSSERIGSQQDTGDSRPKSKKDLMEFHKETEKYFLRLDERADDDVEQETRKERWEETDIRLNTGGPVFAQEEDDVVRSLRVSVLAELVSVSKPSSIAPQCDLLTQLIVDILRLDSSRPVRRAGSLLARELYQCLLRESDAELIAAAAEGMHKDNSALVTSGETFPLAVALVSADEELLHTTLQKNASGLLSSSRSGCDDRAVVDDPATRARCEEALSLREQASEAGLFVAAQLVLAQQNTESGISTLLTGIAKKNVGIVEIDQVGALG